MAIIKVQGTRVNVEVIRKYDSDGDMIVVLACSQGMHCPLIDPASLIEMAGEYFTIADAMEPAEAHADGVDGTHQ